jgi:outer membrane protein TolC
LLRQESAVRAALRNLNLLLVQDEDASWLLTSVLLEPAATGELSTLQGQLATTNRTVQNAVLSQQIAETGVRQAQARLHPVLGLTANWNNALSRSSTDSALPPELLFNPYADGGIESDVTNYGAALTLNFNLFNGGATKRAIEQAQIQVDLALLDHDRLLAEARTALDAAWDRRITAAAIHGMAVQRVTNARLAADIGADRYRDGILNAMDFRALDVALLQAEAAELAARQEWSSAHWEVLRLVGGLRAGTLSGLE